MLDRFELRVALAAAFLGTASLIEMGVRGPAAVRWRGTVLIAAAACLGGAFGVGFDSVTVSISPEYFVFGKGLASDAPRSEALWLGAKAGISGGAIFGCVLSYVGLTRGAPETLLRCGWRAILAVPAWASLGAAVGGVTWWAWASERWATSFAVPAPATRAFLTVWGAHLGVYVGALVGTVLEARRMVRAQRRRSASTAAVGGDSPRATRSRAASTSAF